MGQKMQARPVDAPGPFLFDIPSLYDDEYLFQERSPWSVATNTRRNREEVLELAARISVRILISAYAMAKPVRRCRIRPTAGSSEQVFSSATNGLTKALVADGHRGVWDGWRWGL